MTSVAPHVPAPRSEGGISVLVVDGHRLIAESLARMLPQLPLVREASCATTLTEARRALLVPRVDVVVVSEHLEGESAVQALRQTSRTERTYATIVLGTTAEPRGVARALREGAAAWIQRDCRLDELAEALTVAHHGGHWVAPHVRSGLIDALLEDDHGGSSDGDGPRLSQRQQEVLQGLLEGLSHGEVAERLHLSLNTVRTHVHRMCRLADVHSTPALVALARDGRLALPDRADGPRPR